jgi:hypothetical protein
MIKVMQGKGLAELLEALKGNEEEAQEIPVTPANREEAMRLLHGETLAIGDIVTWRSGMKNARFPREGEEAIVTQVLDQPYRTESAGDMRAAEKHDVAIAMTHHCGRPDCNIEGALVEYLYDSRRLLKIGSALN